MPSTLVSESCALPLVVDKSGDIVASEMSRFASAIKKTSLAKLMAMAGETRN